jgi:hypothetical protein
LGLSAFGSGYVQKFSKCRNKSAPEAPKYRLGKGIRGESNKEPWLRLQISIAPEHFNERDMAALVQRLSAELCHDTDVRIAITDDYEAAKSPDLIPGFGAQHSKSCVERSLHHQRCERQIKRKFFKKAGRRSRDSFGV